MCDLCAGQLHGAKTSSIALSLSHDQPESHLRTGEVLQLGCVPGGELALPVFGMPVCTEVWDEARKRDTPFLQCVT